MVMIGTFFSDLFIIYFFLIILDLSVRIGTFLIELQKGTNTSDYCQNLASIKHTESKDIYSTVSRVGNDEVPNCTTRFHPISEEIFVGNSA
jgi:hypothetical protein